MMNFILSNLPWVWLSLLVIFVVIEAFTMSLTTVWAAIAAFPMIFISKTALPFKWQLLIFLVITIVLVVFTRPFAVKKLKLGKEKTNAASLVGQEVLVISEVSEFKKGSAKAKNGVIWTVTSADSSVIPENTVCIVTKIEGNTLQITKKMS